MPLSSPQSPDAMVSIDFAIDDMIMLIMLPLMFPLSELAEMTHLTYVFVTLLSVAIDNMHKTVILTSLAVIFFADAKRSIALGQSLHYTLLGATVTLKVVTTLFHPKQHQYILQQMGQPLSSTPWSLIQELQLD